jgi:hypothetical protein
MKICKIYVQTVLYINAYGSRGLGKGVLVNILYKVIRIQNTWVGDLLSIRQAYICMAILSSAMLPGLVG